VIVADSCLIFECLFAFGCYLMRANLLSYGPVENERGIVMLQVLLTSQ
jgi:hypothetical protein